MKHAKDLEQHLIHSMRSLPCCYFFDEFIKLLKERWFERKAALPCAIEGHWCENAEPYLFMAGVLGIKKYGRNQVIETRKLNETKGTRAR